MSAFSRRWRQRLHRGGRQCEKLIVYPCLIHFAKSDVRLLCLSRISVHAFVSELYYKNYFDHP